MGAPLPSLSLSFPSYSTKEVLRAGRGLASGAPQRFAYFRRVRRSRFRQPRALPDRVGGGPNTERRGSATGGRAPTSLQAQRPPALHARTALTRRLHPAKPSLTWGWCYQPDDAWANALEQGRTYSSSRRGDPLKHDSTASRRPTSARRAPARPSQPLLAFPAFTPVLYRFRRISCNFIG